MLRNIVIPWIDRFIVEPTSEKLFMFFQFFLVSQLYIYTLTTVIQLWVFQIFDHGQFMLSRYLGMALFLSTLAILALKPLLTKLPPFSLQLFLSVTLFIAHLHLAHNIGILAITTGFICASLIVASISLMNTMYTLSTSVFIAVSFSTLTILTHESIIEYAPVLSRSVIADPTLSNKVFICYLFFLLPYFVLFCLFMVRLKKSWFESEQQIKYFTTTDTMLKLSNRRAITDSLQAVLDRREQGEVTIGHVSVFICDLDHFKHINDQYGHSVGDSVLIEISKTLKESIRDNDRLGRYGGEEFLVTLQDTDINGAKLVAERCRRAIAEKEILIDSNPLIKITASFGVYSTDQIENLDKIIQQADHNLYAAKQSGRNCIVATSCIASPDAL